MRKAKIKTIKSYSCGWCGSGGYVWKCEFKSKILNICVDCICEYDEFKPENKQCACGKDCLPQRTICRECRNAKNKEVNARIRARKRRENDYEY